MTESDRDQLPPQVARTVAGFAESSMGANRVGLVLRDGRRLDGVRVSWATYVVRDPGLPDFDAREVVAAVDQSGVPGRLNIEQGR